MISYALRLRSRLRERVDDPTIAEAPAALKIFARDSIRLRSGSPSSSRRRQIHGPSPWPMLKLPNHDLQLRHASKFARDGGHHGRAASTRLRGDDVVERAYQPLFFERCPDLRRLAGVFPIERRVLDPNLLNLCGRAASCCFATCFNLAIPAPMTPVARPGQRCASASATPTQPRRAQPAQ